MHRLGILTAICSWALFISCSGTAKMPQEPQKPQKETVEKYPAWYYGSQKVVNADSVMYAYATAIDSDSASAVTKAEKWAKSELKSSVSDRLENIRAQALEEQGSGYNLDSSDFLIALRKADNTVGGLAQTQNSAVKTVEGYGSYRSFAEVSIPKKELVVQLEQRLSKYGKAWSAMKKSKAFKKYLE